MKIPPTRVRDEFTNCLQSISLMHKEMVPLMYQQDVEVVGEGADLENVEMKLKEITREILGVVRR